MREGDHALAECRGATCVSVDGCRQAALALRQLRPERGKRSTVGRAGDIRRNRTTFKIGERACAELTTLLQRFQRTHGVTRVAGFQRSLGVFDPARGSEGCAVRLRCQECRRFGGSPRPTNQTCAQDTRRPRGFLCGKVEGFQRTRGFAVALGRFGSGQQRRTPYRRITRRAIEVALRFPVTTFDQRHEAIGQATAT